MLTPMRYAARSVLLLPLAACQPVPPAAAPSDVPERGAYIVTLGSDTVAVEQFARTGDHLAGTSLVRSPQVTVREYLATLRPDGTVSQLEVTVGRPEATAPTQQIAMTFGQDSATVRVQQGDSASTFRVATPTPAFPSLGYSYALTELATRYAAGHRATDTTLVLLPAGSRRTAQLAFRRLGADSAVVGSIAGPSRARVDEQGRLLGLSGAGTTLDVRVNRTDWVDVKALARGFAAREQQGQRLGTLSPLDSVQASVGGAQLNVRYSRPAKRGRVIFGNVVPWNQVWRTGANAATLFTTSRDLLVGGQPVPAGTYSLFTLPRPDGWTLIVNRQTGQWGTQYDATQDLVRIPLEVRPVAQPVETFTIRVTPEGDAARLRLLWDDLEATVPLRPR